MQRLSPEGQRTIDELARRHSVSDDAVQVLLSAIVAGHGRQAQFNHPDLGGMGQWSPGMVHWRSLADGGSHGTQTSR